MVQPINYITNVRTPFEMAMMGRNQALQQDIQQQALEASRAQEEARKQMQADFAKLVEKPNKTSKDYHDLMLKYPERSAEIDRAFMNLTDEQKQNRLSMALSVRGALMREKPEEAKSILQMQVDAARNSGAEDQAAKAEAMIKTIDASPKGALEGINNTIAWVDPKLYDTLADQEQKQAILAMETKEGQAKQKQEMIKAAIEGGLKQAQTMKVLKDTEKLGIETQKAAIELKMLEQQGGIDPEKKFNQEEKIRKEYQSRSKSLTEARDAYSKINISANDKSGASDTALIFSFMKMLDPGSVVREGEFAQAQNTAGLLTNLQNSLKKVESGEFLTDKQREKFSSLAEKYLRSGEKQNVKIIHDYDKLIKDFKLDPEHIFGKMTNASMPKEEPTSGQGTISQKLTPAEQKAAAGARQKTVIKTGIDNKTGRRVVQYSDGTVEYAQ